MGFCRLCVSVREDSRIGGWNAPICQHLYKSQQYWAAVVSVAATMCKCYCHLDIRLNANSVSLQRYDPHEKVDTDELVDYSAVEAEFRDRIAPQLKISKLSMRTRATNKRYYSKAELPGESPYLEVRYPVSLCADELQYSNWPEEWCYNGSKAFVKGLLIIVFCAWVSSSYCQANG